MDIASPGADLSAPQVDAPKGDPSDVSLAAAAAGGLAAVGAAGAGIAAATADKPKKSGFGRLFSRKNKKSSESAAPVLFECWCIHSVYVAWGHVALRMESSVVLSECLAVCAELPDVSGPAGSLPTAGGAAPSFGTAPELNASVPEGAGKLPGAEIPQVSAKLPTADVPDAEGKLASAGLPSASGKLSATGMDLPEGSTPVVIADAPAMPIAKVPEPEVRSQL